MWTSVTISQSTKKQLIASLESKDRAGNRKNKKRFDVIHLINASRHPSSTIPQSFSSPPGASTLRNLLLQLYCSCSLGVSQNGSAALFFGACRRHGGIVSVLEAAQEIK
jgi:hypothetical protein